MNKFTWHTEICTRIAAHIMQHHGMVIEGEAKPEELDEFLAKQDLELFVNWQIVNACIYLQDMPEKNPDAVKLVMETYINLVNNKKDVPHLINETIAFLFQRYLEIPNVKSLDQAFKITNLKGGQSKNKQMTQIILDLITIIIEYEQDKYTAIDTLNQMYLDNDPTGTVDEIPVSTLEEMFQQQKLEGLMTYHIRARLGLTDSDPNNYSEAAKTLIGKYWTAEEDIFHLAKGYYITDE
jgi:hypothetical protein